MSLRPPEKVKRLWETLHAKTKESSGRHSHSTGLLRTLGLA
jgi:hypothetical protein